MMTPDPRLTIRALTLALTLMAAACSTSPSTPANNPPTDAQQGDPCDEEGPRCAQGLVCVEGLCAQDDALANNDTPDATPQGCDDGRPECGGRCCQADESCQDDLCAPNCPSGIVCDGVCCGEGQVCEQDRCLGPCEGTRCGDDLGLCCEGEQVCFAQTCIDPGDPCQTTEQCPPEEICEPSLQRCLPREGTNVCEFRPPVGQFNPELGCRWTSQGLDINPERGDVVATPIVINLTDDNGDGQTNTDDTPDIAFLTYDLDLRCCNTDATLRVVSGACHPAGTMETLASLNEPSMDNSAGIAAGDLNGDGVAEIVAIGMFATNNAGTRNLPQGVIVWERIADDGSQWRVLWTNPTYPTFNVHTRGGALISLADLEGDGQPEVIVGNVVLNGQNGELKWDGVVTSEGTGGIGNNAFLGPYATVTDLDLDGTREVIAGNTVYNADGAVRWTHTYERPDNDETCSGNLPCDGFSAAANFDEDPQGEVVIVRVGQVFVLNHDGTLLWRKDIPVDDCEFNESGPPTVADFDGDGRPEIGTAAADFYVVLDLDCDVEPLPDGCASAGVLWAVPNQDCSSRVTASSVFDFEGDGKAEMVYADETTFRIFDGTTGAILYEDATHGSHTRVEMPVIADVDNDGNSEIVIPENGSREGTPGLEIFKDARDNWVRTRRIWNQHAYSVTNVTEDGQLPAAPNPNWTNGRLNNFRQNVQPAGLFDAPDLTVRAITPDTSQCGNALTLNMEVVVANDGALSVPPGVLIRMDAIGDGQAIPIGTTTTTTRLLPGQTERFGATFQVPDEFPDTVTLQVRIDPEEEINECIEDNNVLSTDVDCILIR